MNWGKGKKTELNTKKMSFLVKETGKEPGRDGGNRMLK